MAVAILGILAALGSKSRLFGFVGTGFALLAVALNFWGVLLAGL